MIFLFFCFCRTCKKPNVIICNFTANMQKMPVYKVYSYQKCNFYIENFSFLPYFVDKAILEC